MITPIIPKEKIEKSFFHTPFWLAPKADVFEQRAIRFQELAEHDNTEWKLYLTLLGDISRAQHQVFELEDNGRNISWPAKIKGSTVLPESMRADVPDDFDRILLLLLNHCSDQATEVTQAVIKQLRDQTPQQRHELAKRVLDYRFENSDRPFVIWVRAALQIIWTAWATQLVEENVPPVDERASCPCCGSDAVGSVVIGSGEKAGVRYMYCPMCNSRWNALRAQCPTCGKSNAMSIQSVDVEATAADVAPLLGAKAESCDECHSYHKLYRLDEQQYADPIADDLASLSIDILMGEAQYLRAGENPFLLLESVENPDN